MRGIGGWIVFNILLTLTKSAQLSRVRDTMLDNYLRSAKDVLLFPLARVFYTTHPTLISVAGLLVGLLAAVMLMQQFYGWGLALWLANRLLDGLDGAVARAANKQSDLGGYLDILFDFVVYSLIPIALVLGAPTVNNLWALAFLLASFYINAASWMYLAAVLEKRQQGAGRRGEKTTVTMPAGLIGGTETIIFYSLFIFWPDQAALLFGLMGSLVLLTVIQRVGWAAKYLD